MLIKVVKKEESHLKMHIVAGVADTNNNWNMYLDQVPFWNRFLILRHYSAKDSADFSSTRSSANM